MASGEALIELEMLMTVEGDDPVDRNDTLQDQQIPIGARLPQPSIGLQHQGNRQRPPGGMESVDDATAAGGAAMPRPAKELRGSGVD